jgi:hypothetical protein
LFLVENEISLRFDVIIPRSLLTASPRLIALEKGRRRIGVSMALCIQAVASEFVDVNGWRHRMIATARLNHISLTASSSFATMYAELS